MARRFVFRVIVTTVTVAVVRPADGQSSPRPIASEQAASIACTCGHCDGDGLLEFLLAPLSTAEDEDGPINTDRPTFTPANATVPKGRFQIESGYTFTHDLTAENRSNDHLFPELATRTGLTDWLEFRTFWAGQTYASTVDRATGRVTRSDGPNDLLVGFGWFFFEQDGWRPQTNLITSLSVPVGGSSPNSAPGVDPVIFLVYGWQLTDRLGLAGSSGLATQLDRSLGDPFADDSFERFSQSFVFSYSATDKATLFYEWFVLAKTNALDNRPDHFMDGGLLYLVTPNLQLDVRAGFGLGDRPDDVFAGAGIAFRY